MKNYERMYVTAVQMMANAQVQLISAIAERDEARETVTILQAALKEKEDGKQCEPVESGHSDGVRGES